MRNLTRPDHLGDVDARPEEAKVLHDPLWMILRKGIAQASKDPHMSLEESARYPIACIASSFKKFSTYSFKPQACLKKTNQLIEVAIALVLLDKIRQLFRMNDEIETTNLR